MLLSSKSFIMSSPSILIELSFVSHLSERMNFFRSNVFRCRSAWAAIEKTSKEVEEEIGLQLFPIVMSAPIIVYPQGVCAVSWIVGSGSKQMSKGRADISLVEICFRSIWSFEVWRMYPAVARAGCRASAHEHHPSPLP